MLKFPTAAEINESVLPVDGVKVGDSVRGVRERLRVRQGVSLAAALLVRLDIAHALYFFLTFLHLKNLPRVSTPG